MDNQQATDIEIGWLAGIVDGEGWIGISVQKQTKGKYNTDGSLSVKCEIKVTNCDEAIIARTTSIFAKLGVNGFRRSHKSLGADRRIVHEVAAKNMVAVQKLLTVLEPELTGNKQERARIILQFIASRKDNPGIKLLKEDGVRAFGPRTVYPYTAHEIALITACRDLQCRGASETTRETRQKALQILIDQYSDYQARYKSKWQPTGMI